MRILMLRWMYAIFVLISDSYLNYRSFSRCNFCKVMLWQVHLVGGFDDISSQVWPHFHVSCVFYCPLLLVLFTIDLVTLFFETLMQQSYLDAKRRIKSEGYSYPLCAKIVDALRNRSEKFQIQTLHVLGHNTKWDSEGIGYPIFHGFVVSLSYWISIIISFCLCVYLKLIFSEICLWLFVKKTL